jgi:hypothetical protein
MIVEKGMPVPKARKSRSKYPMDGMQVGDSFEVPFKDPDVTRTMNAVRAAASRWGQKHKRKFVTRKMEAGIRVWRAE